MSRSNYDKPFYVDVGTSVVAIRCASNHDIVARYAIVSTSYTLNLVEELCDRMNREAETSRPRRNCDVGTAEEQYERLHRFCLNHECRSCPCKTDKDNGVCSIVWTQMPYEEGGAGK